MAPISSKRIELSDAPSTGVGLKCTEIRDGQPSLSFKTPNSCGLESTVFLYILLTLQLYSKLYKNYTHIETPHSTTRSTKNLQKSRYIYIYREFSPQHRQRYCPVDPTWSPDPITADLAESRTIPH